MADSFLEFIPLYPEETEETIRSRWEDWANEGLDPEVDGDRWTDTREGSMFWITTTPGIRESAREYDLMGTEVPASSFPGLAWAEYLDDLAELVELDRLAGTRAEGFVRFIGPEDTLIAAGTTVGVAPVDENDADAPEFEVTTGGTIPGTENILLPVIAKEEGARGKVAIEAITAVISTLPGVSVTNETPTLGGTDAEDDERLRERVLAEYVGGRGGNEYDYQRWLRNQDGVGRVIIIPQFAGQGTVMGIVTDPDGDPLPDARVREIQQDMDPPAWASTLSADVDLPVATLPVVSTAGVTPAPGFVKVGDELVYYTGMTSTTLTGCTGGTAAYVTGQEVTQAGRGGGTAPVNHHVVIKTAVALLVNVEAEVELETGYDLEGEGGEVNVTEAVREAVRTYIESVDPGREVVRAQVAARIAQVEGVHDVGVIELNGVAANLAVPGAAAPQVPFLDDLTLTETVL